MCQPVKAMTGHLECRYLGSLCCLPFSRLAASRRIDRPRNANSPHRCTVGGSLQARRARSANGYGSLLFLSSAPHDQFHVPTISRNDSMFSHNRQCAFIQYESRGRLYPSWHGVTNGLHPGTADRVAAISCSCAISPPSSLVGSGLAGLAFQYEL